MKQFISLFFILLCVAIVHDCFASAESSGDKNRIKMAPEAFAYFREKSEKLMQAEKKSSQEDLSKGPQAHSVRRPIYPGESSFRVYIFKDGFPSVKVPKTPIISQEVRAGKLTFVSCDGKKGYDSDGDNSSIMYFNVNNQSNNKKLEKKE